MYRDATTRLITRFARAGRITDSAIRPSFAAPASSPRRCCSAMATCSGVTFLMAVPPVLVAGPTPRTLSARADEAGGPPSQVLRATGHARLPLLQLPLQPPFFRFNERHLRATSALSTDEP